MCFPKIIYQSIYDSENQKHACIDMHSSTKGLLAGVPWGRLLWVGMLRHMYILTFLAG